MTRWEARGIATRVDGFTLGPIDLVVDGPEAVAVIGRSGAGKTTFLRTLAGLAAPTQGTIRRDDTEVTGLPPEQRGVGFVPQGLGLFPHRTVEGNVRYPLDVLSSGQRKDRVPELIDRFGLKAFAHRRISQLSTGEQQRVAIARALAAEPRLLLWDEPLVSLDVVARDDLLDALREAQALEQIPIVLVTHDAPIAFSLAHQFLTLDEGRVLFQGSGQELLRRPPDPFVARFLGYENIYRRDDLEQAMDRPWARWLERHSGSSGVCFSAHRARVPGEGPTVFEARVRRSEPVPDGVLVEGDSDGLPVALRVDDPSSGGLPVAGMTIRFSLDEAALHPLGPSGPLTGTRQ